MDKRQDIILSPAYITAHLQFDLFERVASYIKQEGISQKELAKRMGVSPSYISQVLNGNFDHKLSKLVELSLAVGYVPQIGFQTIRDYVEADAQKKPKVCYHQKTAVSTRENAYAAYNYA